MRLGSMVHEVKAAEAERKTVKDFLMMLDHFHGNAQKLGAAGMVGYQLTQTQAEGSTGQSSLSGTSTPIINSLYFQISLIAFLYGVLGLATFAGVFIFARCTGKTKEIGWKPVILENISGSRLPHFFAHLSCFVGGIIGFVSVSDRSNSNLPLVLPILMLLSSILNGTANAEQKKNDTDTSTNNASFRAPPNPPRRNALASSMEDYSFGHHVQSQRSLEKYEISDADEKSDGIAVAIDFNAPQPGDTLQIPGAQHTNSVESDSTELPPPRHELYESVSFEFTPNQ